MGGGAGHNAPLNTERSWQDSIYFVTWLIGKESIIAFSAIDKLVTFFKCRESWKKKRFYVSSLLSESLAKSNGQGRTQQISKGGGGGGSEKILKPAITSGSKNFWWGDEILN